MASRPEKNSARLRHWLSLVETNAPRSGSREFQPSSARRTFCTALSRVNGGNGGLASGVVGMAACCCVDRGLVVNGDDRHGVGGQGQAIVQRPPGCLKTSRVGG